jgi:hypothetical protein
MKPTMKHFYQSFFMVGASLGCLFTFSSAAQAAVLWDTLQPNSKIGFSSQLDIPTEAADDFTVTGDGFTVTDVSFLGLFTDQNADVGDIDLAFYSVFPGASDLTRTPATVRTNGPEDAEFVAFSLAEDTLSYTEQDLGDFTIEQAILPSSGANAPGVGSGTVGGPVKGYLRQIDAKLKNPLTLPPDAVFLVNAVEPSAGEYFQVAGSRPPISPDTLSEGSEAAGGIVDRQAWFRTNEPFPNALEPDWVRVSDVINQTDGTAEPAFNSAFRVSGENVAVSEPVTVSLFSLMLLPALLFWRRLKAYT